MQKIVRCACLISMALSGIFAGEAQKKENKLVWADEFDKDGRPDPKKWTYENGFVRNEELQWPDRQCFCRDGMLVIEGRREQKSQPVELLDLYEVLACLARKTIDDRVKIQAGNNIGYYGPYERLLRDHPDGTRFWQGCTAGLNVLGIEADGTIKGCPSLPTASYSAFQNPLSPQSREGLEEPRKSLRFFASSRLGGESVLTPTTE